MVSRRIDDESRSEPVNDHHHEHHPLSKHKNSSSHQHCKLPPTKENEVLDEALSCSSDTFMSMTSSGTFGHDDCASSTNSHDADHLDDSSAHSCDSMDSDSSHDPLAFPPGHGTDSDVLIPSYFLCPITGSIMQDPVIDREGNTFERSAILRWLVLQSVSPVTGNPVSIVDLTPDKVVKGAIEKARKDAWVKYVLDFEEQKKSTKKGDHRVERHSIKAKANPAGLKPIDSPREKHSDCSTPPHPPPAKLPASAVAKCPPPPYPHAPPRSHSHSPPPPPPPPKNRRRCPDGSIVSSSSQGTASTVASTVSVTPSSGASVCASVSSVTSALHNGWTAPLGVHKVVCSSPGLAVTMDVHRRSAPVKRKLKMGGGGDGMLRGPTVTRDLIIPPGSYIEVVETQVHGGRVRGRIVWEEEEAEQGPRSGRPKTKRRSTRRFLRRARSKSRDVSPSPSKYSGWISLQWAEEDEEDHAKDDGSTRIKPSRRGSNELDHRITDEDEGPWTEPVPLGVYRINFGAGLPLRQTPERDSTVLDKLERGRCVEVVETQVKGDRVRARCIVPPPPQGDADEQNSGDKEYGGKFQNGWISLLNAVTGSSGASPVPLGAYVVVSESGCVVTEGGRIDSKMKGTFPPGSCIEVVATRIEEGVVRGLIAAGGHVTLFVPPGKSANKKGGANKKIEGGKMYAMPVPLGTYQVIYQNGLPVTTGIGRNTAITMKLKVDACAEIVETRVEDGRVRGRMSAVGYGGAAKEACGWISLFEPSYRWAKIVCFKGGRPIPQGGQAGVARWSDRSINTRTS